MVYQELFLKKKKGHECTYDILQVTSQPRWSHFSFSKQDIFNLPFILLLFLGFILLFSLGGFPYGTQSFTTDLYFLLFTLQIPRKTKPAALQCTWRRLKRSKTEWVHVAGGQERLWENHSRVRKYPRELLHSFLIFTSAKANYALCYWEWLNYDLRGGVKHVRKKYVHYMRVNLRENTFSVLPAVWANTHCE